MKLITVVIINRTITTINRATITINRTYTVYIVFNNGDTNNGHFFPLQYWS